MTKLKSNAYQYWAFRIPVANSNTALETSSVIPTRSTACAGLATGGHANRRGMTDHSFATRNGTAASPPVTCRPWVTPYSQAGRVGQVKVGGRSAPDGTIAFPRRSG